MKVKIPSKPSVIASRLEDYIYVLYGAPGTGKTRFVWNLFGKDKVLFLSTDRGTRDISCRRVECQDWPTVKGAVKSLEDNGLNGIEALCFDHVDDIAEMLSDYVCDYHTQLNKQGVVYESFSEIPYGKGWVQNRKELHNLINRVLKLGICPVFIAHEDIRTIKTGGMEIDKIMPAINKQAAKIILPLANMIGQIAMKRLKSEGGKKKDYRVLVTQPKQDLYAKDRTLREKPSEGYELLDAKAFRETFKESSDE